MQREVELYTKISHRQKNLLYSLDRFRIKKLKEKKKKK